MWRKIDPRDLGDDVFTLIGERQMLITAGTEEKCNTMTASWGGLGVLWGKKVATIYVRPQRFTREFLEREGWFTLSFFDDSYRPQLALCGSKSGRDVDKIKECGFTVKTGEGDAPYIAEAELVLVCRKLYWQDMDPSHFVDGQIEQHYPQKDYHRMYIGEIVEALAERAIKMD